MAIIFDNKVKAASESNCVLRRSTKIGAAKDSHRQFGRSWAGSMGKRQMRTDGLKKIHEEIKHSKNGIKESQQSNMKNEKETLARNP
eukprot:CAMPEP_0172321210 /NCGR_PEP_ID=MMETSP1058-20130122/42707_1 /TAXON_ID=83371 /ORGANISM="Detonula confervacea, Strain CCMP 353" /LENGTH=86 /DNA_ID=CAMNT_0013036653 /DNA_START=60 /DNA_END=320 /DNA_ORIENTATION=-